MKILLAATAASAALALATGAGAQSQYGGQGQPGDQYGPPAYDQGYDDQGAGDQDQGDEGYGSPPPTSQPQGYGQPSNGYPGQGYGRPSTTHYPTGGYPRVPDAGGVNPPNGYAQDTDPGDYTGSDYGAGGDGYPTDNDGGYQQDWNNDQSGGPPPPRQGYGPRAGGSYAPPPSPGGGGYGDAMTVPVDLAQREQRLERQIRRMDERGRAPGYATDNLMIVLNSIRDQQDELSRRDNGLNFTDRRFIEGRLDRLEEQVRALR